jgi:hypothetical protein
MVAQNQVISGHQFRDHTDNVSTLTQQNGNRVFEGRDIVGNSDEIKFSHSGLVSIHSKDYLDFFILQSSLSVGSSYNV